MFTVKHTVLVVLHLVVNTGGNMCSVICGSKLRLFYTFTGLSIIALIVVWVNERQLMNPHHTTKPVWEKQQLQTQQLATPGPIKQSNGSTDGVTTLQDVMDDTNFILPDMNVLARKNLSELYDIYWRYVNSIQTICHHVQRLGHLKDGGKETCVDEQFVPRRPCLVYSFGINFMFDFDEDVEKYFGCEVHSFDPSMNTKRYQHSKLITFHPIGLSNRDIVIENNNWTFMTLGSIRKKLGHEKRTIDILKIDIEGMEWRSLHQAMMSRTIDDVRQLLIEFHLRGSKKEAEDAYFIRLNLRILRNLYNHRFRICMRERNLKSIYYHPYMKKHITLVNELTLVNVK